MGTATRSRRVGALVAALLSVALVATACSSSSSAPPTTAPHGLPSFYVVPDGVSSKAPGTLLKFEKTTVGGVQAAAYRVMYVSTGIGGKNVAARMEKIFRAWKESKKDIKYIGAIYSNSKEKINPIIESR